MLHYHDYVARHGEFGVQAIIELIEYYDGIRLCTGTSLEERWNALMQNHRIEQNLAAA
jgi:hypothetical protein